MQGLFLRSSPAFYKTDWVGNSTAASGVVQVTNPAILAVTLRNPDTGDAFWIVRHLDSTSTCVIQ
jgi:hypothetical protein